VGGVCRLSAAPVSTDRVASGVLRAWSRWGENRLTFDEIVEQQYGRLVRVARLIVFDEGRAREIVQETFARALVRWDRIGNYDRPDAWLMTVTVRQAVRVRDRSRREIPSDAAERSLTAAGPAASVEAHVLVQQGLAGLSTQQRAVVVLYHLEDLPIAEVADRLGVSAGTVKTQLSRARARLAELLDPDHEEVSP